MTGQFFRSLGAALVAGFALAPGLALGREAGRPVDGQLGFQESVTPIQDSIEAFHDGILMWSISGIVVLVAVLLIIVMLRFNRRANPSPSGTTHNTLLEIAWTVVPVLVLILIAIPSFGVLTDQLTTPDGQRKYLGANIFSFGEVEVPAPGVTVKVTASQWYWTYEYVDNGGAGFDSNLLPEADRTSLKPNQPRLLAVDNELVVPVDTTVRLQITAADVIHAFAVPSFGVRLDAVPGRLHETWFNARKTGIYYGQCSELCGKDHAYMPIAVRVVTQDEYAVWIKALEEGNVADATMTLAAVN